MLLLAREASPLGDRTNALAQMAPPGSEPRKDEFPVFRGVRRRLPPWDPLFSEGNAAREILAKQAVVVHEEADINGYLESIRQEAATFPCPVRGCKAVLRGQRAFEDHSESCHDNACRACGLRLPTARLLDIHISETHDPFFAGMAVRSI
mmetsp:Transcript_6135/g.21013  ORF Transcript_6135/g.21013 Transcript_6135/m.21013 type:complete len:150 (+) Transcript_6135:303-752(+)